jgi:hypothetical protein
MQFVSTVVMMSLVGIFNFVHFSLRTIAYLYRRPDVNASSFVSVCLVDLRKSLSFLVTHPRILNSQFQDSHSTSLVWAAVRKIRVEYIHTEIPGC